MDVVATRSESLVSFLPFPTKIEVGGRILMKASEFFCKIRPLSLKPSSIKVLAWIFINCNIYIFRHLHINIIITMKHMNYTYIHIFTMK